MFGQSLLSAFGIACTTDTDQLFIEELKAGTKATYQFNSNADSLNIAGKFGDCGNFDTSSSYIDSNAPLPPTSTISFWFNTSSDPNDGNWVNLIDNGGSMSAQTGVAIFRAGNGGFINLYFTNGQTGQSQLSVGTTNICDGQWHNIVLSLASDDTFVLYLDGISHLSGTRTRYTQGATPTYSYIRFGQKAGSVTAGNQLYGSMDQIRVYNSSLSASQAADLYNETTSTVSTLNYPITATALYQLNGNATDTGGNYNGTASNVTWAYNATASNITYATGKFDNAAVFNGSNSEIVASSSITPSSGGFAISWWQKTTQADNTYGYTIDNGGGSLGNGLYIITHNTSNGLIIGFKNGSTFGSSSVPYSSEERTQWTHFCFSWDGTTATNAFKIYKNNIATSFTSTVTNTSAAYPFRIGRSYNGTDYFGGLIDQVRIFSSSLSQAAVTALYNETPTTAAYNYIDYEQGNSVAYYKMANATDQLSNYNGTATDVNFNIEGKFGFAGAFNGSSSVITLPAAFSSTYEGSTTWSFSAWVDVNSSNANKNFFTKYNSSVQVGGIQIGTDASGYLNFFVANTSDQRQHNRGNTALSTNTWHHICAVWSSGTMYLYLDGSAETLTNESNTYTGSTIPTTTTSSTKSNRFGAVTYGGGSTSYSDIKLDQIRVFDEALTATEVNTLYKEVYCQPAAIVGTNFYNTVLYSGSSSAQSITTGFQPDLTWIKCRTDALSNILHDSLTQPGLLVSNNWNALIDNGSNTVDFTSNGFNLQGGGSHTSVNSNGDTFASWSWKAGADTYAGSFNGTSSYIDTNAAFSPTLMSFSAWVYPTSISHGSWYARNIISNRNGNTGGYNGIDFGIVTGTGNLYTRFSDGSNQGSTSSNTVALPVDTWTHVAFTVDTSAAEAKVYKNGSLQYTVTIGTGSQIANGNDFFIGRYWHTADYFWNGMIDQVRIFNTTLSASEVTSLYNETASENTTLNFPAGAGCTAAYTLNETANDLSGNYNGTASNVNYTKPGYTGRNNDGSIESQVSVNPNGGFSIVKYAGNGNTSQESFGHGLSSPPELIIQKGIDTLTVGTNNWVVGGTGVTPNAGEWLELNTTDPKQQDPNYWGNQPPNSTVVYISGTAALVSNESGKNFINYCFKSIPGYSRVGSYIGQTAGVTIYTGFEPRFIMVKSTSNVENWAILDAARGSGKCLNPNLSNAESDSTLNTFTTTSTGFSFPHQNTADAMLNENGYKYMFFAIA